MELSNVFANKNNEVATSARSLSGTAELTAQAGAVANEVLKKLEVELPNVRTLFDASRSNHDAMDELVSKLYDLEEVDIQYLKELSEDELDRMLKSQQSKRSRAKGKQMTFDNYRAMMIGAIAENLIRLALGKEKSAGGASTLSTNGLYSEEALAVLAADPEKLRKEIRNVQSKKSIMKSKADFSEDSDAWTMLLMMEQQLKETRGTTAPVKIVEVDKTKNLLDDLLGGKSIEELTPDEAKELLDKLQEGR